MAIMPLLHRNSEVATERRTTATPLYYWYIACMTTTCLSQCPTGSGKTRNDGNGNGNGNGMQVCNSSVQFAMAVASFPGLPQLFSNS